MQSAQATVTGWAAKDPEMRYLPSGDAVTKITIPVTKKRSGRERTTWYECILFGKRAEQWNEWAHKGTPLLITGELDTSTYQKHDGSNGFSVEITVNTIVKLVSRKDENAQANASGDDAGSSGDAPSGEDIPF